MTTHSHATGGSQGSATTAGGQPMVWQAAGIGVIGVEAVAQNGVLTGMTATTSCADMAIISLMMHDEIEQYRG